MRPRPAYHVSTPIEDRAGPDDQDLTRTRARDDAATARLAGAGLPVLDVTVDQSGEHLPLVRYRNAPTIEQQKEAESLLGYVAQHIC